MVDLVFSYIAKAVLIIASCFLYVFLISDILPKLILVPKNKKAEPKDRGIKRYVFDCGRAIVYIPEPETKKYISQYILSENNGEKFLKCKFDRQLSSVDYEITVFDSSDKVTDTIKVYDTPAHGELSRAVPLPLSAAYVNISVIEINRKRISVRKKRHVPVSSGVLYFALNFAATAAISLMINAAAVHVADLCLRFTEKTGSLSILFPIISALIISAIYSARTIKKQSNSD